MTETAYLSHRSPGRLRLRFPGRRGDARFFAGLTERLGAGEGVTRVEGNPRTGSVLVLHAGDATPILELGRRERLFRLDSPVPLEPSPAARLRAELEWLGDGLRRLARGEVDPGMAAFLLLLAGGMVQTLRGQMPGPGAALLWYAGSMLAAGISSTRRPAAVPVPEDDVEARS